MQIVRVISGDGHLNGRIGCLYTNLDGATLIFFGDFTVGETTYYDASFGTAGLEYEKLTEGF